VKQGKKQEVITGNPLKYRIFPNSENSMTTRGISMRNLREILRLRLSEKLSLGKISRACRVSKGALSRYLALAQAIGLTQWPLAPEINDAELERLLRPGRASTPTKNQPDFGYISHELTRKNVTLELLWEEYLEADPVNGYCRSQYCHLYRAWQKRQPRSMRQIHKAGEKGFSDFAGTTVPIINGLTGEIHEAQIFVMALGASSYTYSCAVMSQKLPDWIKAHQQAFEFFGGVPSVVVPDNLKSAVTTADRYEPELNPTFQEFGQHFGCVIIPARPYKPKDKAKAEVAVQIVGRWILARLRNRQFFSLQELNKAIAELLPLLNRKLFKKKDGSRQSWFETVDKPALKPLPTVPYAFGIWKKVRVSIDYHVDVEGHFYSVPYALIGKQLDTRYTADKVELMHKGKAVACHNRAYTRGSHSTHKEHMPKAHRKHMEWTPGRILNWANSIGPHTLKLVHHLLENRPHPEQGYRSCLGLLSLSRKYGSTRLESACQRAILLGSLSRRSVASILEAGLDKQPLPLKEEEKQEAFLFHPNVRGSDYYV
jgi:transposase